MSLQLYCLKIYKTYLKPRSDAPCQKKKNNYNVPQKNVILAKNFHMDCKCSHGLQLYCFIITVRLSSICVTKLKAGLFSLKYLCSRFYKMTPESKTSSLALSLEAMKDCATCVYANNIFPLLSGVPMMLA